MSSRDLYGELGHAATMEGVRLGRLRHVGVVAIGERAASRGARVHRDAEPIPQLVDLQMGTGCGSGRVLRLG